MLTLWGATEVCENPEKPGTKGVHICTHSAYKCRGLESLGSLTGLRLRPRGGRRGAAGYKTDSNTRTLQTFLTKDRRARRSSPGGRGL